MMSTRRASGGTAGREATFFPVQVNDSPVASREVLEAIAADHPLQLRYLVPATDDRGNLTEAALDLMSTDVPRALPAGQTIWEVGEPAWADLLALLWAAHEATTVGGLPNPDPEMVPVPIAEAIDLACDAYGECDHATVDAHFERLLDQIGGQRLTEHLDGDTADGSGLPPPTLTVYLVPSEFLDGPPPPRWTVSD